MMDGQQYILNLLYDHGPLTREAILQFAFDEDAFDIEYVKDSLGDCEEDSLVRVRDGVVSLPPIVCPCCGSEDTTQHEKPYEYTPPFGETIHYQVGVVQCNACKEGWRTEGHEFVVRAAIRKADVATVGPMLDYLLTLSFYSDLQVSEGYIKQVLGLPKGTIEKWRGGEITPGELTLLRLLRTCPALLLVAGCRYELGDAKLVFVKDLKERDGEDLDPEPVL